MRVMVCAVMASATRTKGTGSGHTCSEEFQVLLIPSHLQNLFQCELAVEIVTVVFAARILLIVSMQSSINCIVTVSMQYVKISPHHHAQMAPPPPWASPRVQMKSQSPSRA